MVDDIAYDAKLKRLYLSGDQFVEIFKQDDADHYTSMGKVASGFRAKTALFVPELNRYFLAVPRHNKRDAAVKVYEPNPIGDSHESQAVRLKRKTITRSEI
jgi:hypothetical protein